MTVDLARLAELAAEVIALPETGSKIVPRETELSVSAETVAALVAAVQAAEALYERVEMDESVGICLSSRAEALNLDAALAPFRGDPA